MLSFSFQLVMNIFIKDNLQISIIQGSKRLWNYQYNYKMKHETFGLNKSG